MVSHAVLIVGATGAFRLSGAAVGSEVTERSR